ncbi:hypothetical protein PIB30_084882 [Stylosanthes scabra]|uniref:PORR domain-containing protein n=1 Tax=Stylosanthes scabra TaxID=79078 RepID=A0ABU6YS63_9FABA|nr:hypothetical protein [Stylosanthes scabra]
MISVDKHLPLEKFAHFRRDFGLPMDFRANWVHQYPQHFRVVKSFDGIDQVECLELVTWNPNWAITELEKKVTGVTESTATNVHVPGMLSLPFPLKFPSNYKRVYRYSEKIEDFQKRSYLSPNADATRLKAGSLEFDKRIVAVIHEILSFTIEKRLVTDHLTHFRWEMLMPQKLMRILLKHIGIFYVSERGKRFSVFLSEAYDGAELIEKPLEGDIGSIQSDSEVEDLDVQFEQQRSVDYEDPLAMDNSEMDIEEIACEYRNSMC